MLNLKPVIAILGHYGSGKTEFSINLALALRSWHPEKKIIFADLDIVNPYFRSSERRELLAQNQIELISSSLDAYSDLPALPPSINSLWHQRDNFAIADIGGDPVGARVISRYKGLINPDFTDFIFVYNQSRPEIASLKQALSYLRLIEDSSRQKINKVINNTHLMQASRIEDVIEGEKIALELCQEAGIDFAFNLLPRHLEQDKDKLSQKSLIIDIYMKKPWE